MGAAVNCEYVRGNEAFGWFIARGPQLIVQHKFLFCEVSEYASKCRK